MGNDRPVKSVKQESNVTVVTPERQLGWWEHGLRKRGGGRGKASPAVEKSAGDVPQKLRYFSILFSSHMKFLHFPSYIFKIKWPNSEEKLNFGGRWTSVPMSPSPPPKQNFVATPLGGKNMVPPDALHYVSCLHLWSCRTPLILLHLSPR